MLYLLLVEPEEYSQREAEQTNDREKVHQVWEFCKSQSKSVEVLYKNMNGDKILTRIHFPIDPHVMK